MLWLAVDPGEDTGWALFEDERLVDAGTEKLWAFGDSVFMAVFRPEELDLVGDELAKLFVGIEKIVAEDWRLYPNEMKKGSLAWDQCRTARLLGSLTQTCRMGGLELILQGAKIKKAAEAAGAKALFMAPLEENRHANDAIRHGVYYLAIQHGAKAVEMEDEPTRFDE